MAKVYSVSESDVRLLSTVKQALLPRDFRPSEYYVPQGRIGNAGIPWNEDRQREMLASFGQPAFQSLFQLLRRHREINVGFGGNDYLDRELIHNGFYPTPDAEIYAAMIAATRPRRIVEVGSGYSTVIARTTVDYLGLDCEIHVIDPEPRREIDRFANRIEYEPVERSSLRASALSRDTLLFIDSSHVCRSQGDVPFLYCQILPALPAGMLVHIHDIFLPFDYPDNYFERFYNEQYVLHALLTHSTRFEVVFATHYLSREHKEAMQTVFGPSVGTDPLFYGASFWMRSRD